MKTTRIAAILLLSFLFGGSGAEVAVQTHRAIARHRAAEAVEDGAAGQLVALQIERGDGTVVARPRLIASPGRVADLVLHDPERPDRVRLALRVIARREASGSIALEYALAMPDELVHARGQLRVAPGIEQRVDLGGPLSATVLTVPVPSAAFDAYLEAERAARLGLKST